MPEVVKSPAMMLIAVAVFLLLIIIVVELFFYVKIGRAICKFVGGLLLSLSGYTGYFFGLTQQGIELACNGFPF